MVQFEIDVFDLINPFLLDDELSEFIEGSLFIETDMVRGRFIQDILSVNGYNTLLNKCGREIAIDFV
jgi:hypothetical protein